MGSALKMTWKKTDNDNPLLWGVIIILIGTTILTASHSIYKGIQLDLVHEEVRELRYQLNKLQVKEDEVGVEVERQKRQVDMFSRPEVLDYAYNARLPESESELSVYDKWYSGNSHQDEHGLSKHHKLSASWTGEDDYDNDNQHIGEEFYQDDESYRRHRSSRVSQTQGHFIEIPGRLTHRGQYKTTTPTTTTTTPPPPPPKKYKKPELKSLGTPDKPTKSSTAIQLEAAAGGHWRLSRWAMRMNADIGFPVTQDGRVGVPSPGLYLVYAQVTYVDKHKYQGFSVLVNDNVAIECQEHGGMEMEMMCHTSGLLYLEQGDKVSIRDLNVDRKTDVSHGKTFFGLVKLTADWI